MNYDNEMILKLKAISQNEAFARVSISAFISPLDPVISEITDVKTAVSEAVTNSIIHGYENKGGWVTIEAKISDRTVYIEIIDEGRGINDIEQATTPLYTSKPELERSGMGFTVMESFMDTVKVISSTNEGTRVIMTKTLS